MYHITQANWEIRETASYKLLTKGINAVSDLELLSTLIGNEATAKILFQKYGSLSAIARTDIPELTQTKGIGRKTALCIVSAFEIARRKDTENQKRLQITNSRTVARYMQPKYADCEREIFSVLFVNRNNELIAEEAIFTGGVSAVVVDPKIIFRKALNYLASAILLVHNHPSGNLNPSQADKDITRKLSDAAKLFDMKVLDHLIVSQKGYYSFADEGNM